MLRSNSNRQRSYPRSSILSRLHYHYKPLADSNEIRLLYLQPRSSPWSPNLQCSVHHVKFSDIPNYEALSYMWGPPEESKSISLDETPVWIRDNLFSALEHLQLEDRPRTLWIDALCINQNDVEERNHQVTQMGRIYSQARRVVVWVGDYDAAGSGISAMSEFVDAPKRQGDWFNTTDLASIRSFCSREYWERLWIIQEIILAADLVIYCGDQQASWSSMHTVFSQIEAKSRQVRNVGSDKASYQILRRDLALDIRKSIPARLCRQWQDRQKRGEELDFDTNLHDLCFRYTEAKCADHRDKIFGLVGIAPQCCRKALHVDYSLSEYEVCGLVLEHYTTCHIYDEASKHAWRSIHDTGSSSKTPGLVVQSSQIFHQVMRVTKPHISATTSPPVSMPAPLIRLSSSADTVISVKLEENSQESNWQSRFQKFVRRLRKRNSVERSIESPGTPAVNERIARRGDCIIDELIPRPIRAQGQIRGRIMHLSHPLSTTDRIDWIESMENYIAGDGFIMEQLKRIMGSSVAVQAAITIWEKHADPVITSELDLVCSNTNSKTVVAFADIWKKVNLKDSSGKYRNPKRWKVDSFAEPSNRLDHERETLHRTPGFEHSGSINEACRIAIEDTGYICFVPTITQLDDLICFFPESDTLAVVGGSEKPGQLRGRGADMVKNLLNPHFNPATDLRALFYFDIAGLQLLTYASAMPDT